MTSAQTTPTAAVRPGRIRRVPAIDGLRGLAVAAVVLYHFFGRLLPGGYLGVDVFFVLSGFLITSLLVREHATTGRINLATFWKRRVRRILPAAAFVLIVGVIAARLVGGDPAVGLGAQFFGSLFFVNNWTQIAQSQSYFADQGVQVFAHYWSLAVEEQFYIIWPLALIALYAIIRRRGANPDRAPVVFAVVLSVAAALWMAWLHIPGEDPTRVYYGTDTHIFGLGLGAALAFALTTRAPSPIADSWPFDRGPAQNQALAAVVGILGLLGLIALFFVLPDTATITYRGGLFLASVCTAGLLLAVVRGAGPTAGLFALAPLRWLGERSFSLYLWHWPVMVLVSAVLVRSPLRDVPALAGVASLVISLPLSAWSYRWIETPIRRHGYRAVLAQLCAARPQIRFAVPAVATLAVLATGASILTAPQQTTLERDLAAAAAQQQNADKADDLAVTEDREFPDGDQITAIGDSVMLASLDALQTEFPGIYVDGDVSRHWESVPAIAQAMEANGTLDPFVVLGFGTNGPSSGAYEGLLDDIIEQLGPDRVIVLVLPYGDRWYMPEAEEEILAAGKKYDNVFIADWCHAAKADVTRLRADLVHPTPPGALAYVGAIRDALDQWVEGDYTDPGVCGV
ncbi:acyltransferase [Corynebacterium sp. TAE3-ERU12]|uniref:acyltransferase family protein n=1 Tax=Corynebacterium sp. TAE3-ERU12 TaxID=2849491 RepID=UPI001C4604BC|nr:acyltransferase [Corynebacterium sp. TAE3-ERU12]